MTGSPESEPKTFSPEELDEIVRRMMDNHDPEATKIFIRFILDHKLIFFSNKNSHPPYRLSSPKFR